MVFAGIDYSKTSTSLAVNKDGQWHLYTFPCDLKWESKSRKWLHHRALRDLFIAEVIPYQRTHNSTMDYSDAERAKGEDAYLLAKLVMQVLSKYKDDGVVICTEGYSYASEGAAFIDQISFQTTFRVMCKVLGYRLEVASPTQIKMLFSGLGNSGKSEMLDAFLSMEGTVAPKLYDYCKRNISDIRLDRKGKVEVDKPIDDLVDSVAICQYMILMEEGSLNERISEILEKRKEKEKLEKKSKKIKK